MEFITNNMKENSEKELNIEEATLNEASNLRRCPRCKISIVDDTIECPLCHGVVENAPENRNMEEASISLTYPDISVRTRVLRLIIRIALFLAIATEVIVVLVNYVTFNGIYWSCIVGLGLCYGCATLLYSVRKRRSMQRIVQVQLFLSIFFLLLLDFVLGFKGWSISYAVPIALLSVDTGMLVLMIVRINGWQNFIMTEIVAFILSIVVVVLDITGKFGGEIFGIIAVVITGLILLGTVMIGNKMVSNEIKRRFMI